MANVRIGSVQSKYLTLDEAAVVCGVSRQALYATWIPAGLPTVRIGNRRLVPRAEFEAWLDTRPEDWLRRGGRNLPKSSALVSF